MCIWGFVYQKQISRALIIIDILQNAPCHVSNLWQTFWLPALEIKEGLGRHGLKVWRLMSMIVAWLALTHKPEIHGKLVFHSLVLPTSWNDTWAAPQSKNWYGWRILWDFITYACLWYLLLAHKSSYCTGHIIVTFAVVILHPLSWNASSHGLNGFQLIADHFLALELRLSQCLLQKPPNDECGWLNLFGVNQWEWWNSGKIQRKNFCDWINLVITFEGNNIFTKKLHVLIPYSYNKHRK